jgi:5-methylcytosine-specific restriction endonuclease McrBC regulatory subunit McrC
MRINLTDNNWGTSEAQMFQRNEVSALFEIADRNLSDLCEKYRNLLVIPSSMGLSNDQIENSPILSIANTTDPDIVTIKTGNIMGFIGVGNLQVKIKSRFDDGRADYFLHYMLQRVLSFNIFDLNHSNEREDILDMMMFLFPYLLKNAMRQGIYREYQQYEHNDSNMKGPLNANRHVKHNQIFIGNIAYSTREYSLDNSLTELIRHTIEFMRLKKYGRAILDVDSETSENVASIVAHTPQYNKGDRNKIIQKNLRSKTHPYYTGYKPLQSLCLQILRMEELKYGESEEEIFGILFDGAWLWEEYVNTILCIQGFVHPENKIGKGAIYLFRDEHDGKIFNSGRRYPDFYKDGFVLDAKYKRFGSYNKVSLVDRNDIHQVMAYMSALAANRGGFVVPLTAPLIPPPTSHIRGSDATLSIFGIEVSKENGSYSKFCSDMQAKEQSFINSINQGGPSQR